MHIHTIDKHFELFQEVFTLLQKYKPNIKELKYHLSMEMVDLLGYVIDAKGINIDKGKVDIITKWPWPFNLTKVQ